MTSSVDCIIIGGGIIGLAIARALAPTQQVIVLEAKSQVGSETSFRNSAVVHAGIYYQPDSLKAQFCPEGAKKLYAYCDKQGITYKKIGKLIVATNTEQLQQLEALAKNAQLNEVKNLQWLTTAKVQQMEPEIKCVAALYSPNTGIVDGKQLLQSYLHDAQFHGAKVLLNTSFQGALIESDGILVSASGALEIKCRYLINAAGLYAPQVASLIQGLASHTIPPQYFAKGNYFRLNYESPFSHLIYPIPEQAGLGIHATINLQGETLFGPDVEWVDRINYDVNEAREPLFYAAIKQYYPGLRPNNLVPLFSGIRPKISCPTDQPQDFMIQTADEHKIVGLVNLYGIESPGLTASLAIGDYVGRLIQ